MFLTLVGMFFALLAPSLEPKALRVTLQATYAVLAAATVVLLVVTTCAADDRASRQFLDCVSSSGQAQQRPVLTALLFCVQSITAALLYAVCVSVVPILACMCQRRAIDAADTPQSTQRSDQRTGFYCPYCEVRALFDACNRRLLARTTTSSNANS